MLAWLAGWLNSPGPAAASSFSLGSYSSLLPDGHLPSPGSGFPEQEAGERPPGISPGEAYRLLLPDLRTMPPYDLEINTLPDGSRELRLTNAIWNSGAGPLELEGKTNAVTRQTRVVQHVRVRVGSHPDYLVGEFVWHPTHDHWHFEEFSIYELWSLTPAGELDEVISSSGKLSYCVIDTNIIDRENGSFTPRRRYYGCGRTLQGLTPGWGDTYKSYLDGQSIRLAAVTDGIYALKSTANPDAILLESNYDNNVALLYLEIRGESVTLIGREDILERRCLENGWC